MHTSWVVYLIWSGGIAFAVFAQAANYYGTPKQARIGLKRWGFWLGIVATGLAAWAGWKTATDWANLPMAPDDAGVGQLWDDGGIPAIVESDERNAAMKRAQDAYQERWQRQHGGDQK